ncbi:MAG TPA: DUF3142 domain-containing protein [Bryobacteraceae bacterium]|nr:DUF3142 domain-containing protein [Bryobacteraceae bacterium]
MKTALVILAFTALAALAYRPQHDPLPQFPRTIVWAWERPEKLDFIDPHEVGVAFLARTVYIRGGVVTVRPRLQPLVVAPGTALMAVVRIESQGIESASRADVEHAIIEATELRGVRALQIDYDARASERDFYRAVLADLHRVLPSSMPLSMTALASWCESDNWISGLPVTEAVPMLFRMGAGEAYHPGEDFRPGVCRSSVGISTDEPLLEIPRGRRVYIFHPRSWSATELRAAVQEVRRWQ